MTKKILCVINTPAQFHFWKNIINRLKKDNLEVNIIARDYESTCKLLKDENYEFQTYVRPSSNKLQRSYQIIPHVVNAYRIGKRYNPDIILGFGVVEAITAKLLGKTGIIYTDSERIPLQNYITKICANTVITPSWYIGTFGNKHYRIEGYKELAYLHPNYFMPDENIYNELGINKSDKYAILRFNAWDAVHDIGKHGFTTTDQIEMVENLGKYVRVFISPGSHLSPNLTKFVLPIKSNRIHHALYYADLLVTDTQTMATEAAILGTPVIRSNSYVGDRDMGVFKELEQKYNLMYSYKDTGEAVRKATELIKETDLKNKWMKKRTVLLSDKIDIASFMLNFIENYPNSLH